MNILFFTDHFWPEPSAPAAHVFERATYWVKWGHNVTVICSAPNFPEGKVFPGYSNALRQVEHLNGIRVVRVKTFITRNEGFFLRILDYLSFTLSSFFFSFFEKKPDVVISTSPHLFVPVSALFYAKLRNLPHVLEVRDLWPESIVETQSMKQGAAYTILLRLARLLYRHSVRIIALTGGIAEHIARHGVEPEKIAIVINGANLDLFSPQAKDQVLAQELGLNGSFTVGYLGTMGLAHGLENIIHTAITLREYPIKFLFVGTGAAKTELERLSIAHGLSNVLFAGMQLKENMPRYWSLCDISMIHLRNSPIFRTAIPSKIFESMAMGKPILYVGPISEGVRIVESEHAGVHVSPENPRSLHDAILQLFNNPHLLDAMASNAACAAVKYSRKKQAEDSFEVLQSAYTYIR
jgi:colanic acid biosynthesis glycosyl transferase WcaI